MLSDIQFFLVGVIPVLLWFYPILKWSRFKWKQLILHIVIQVLYSLLFIWLIIENPGTGYMSIWLFYWFFAIIIHLIGLNIWTFIRFKRIK